MRHFVAESIRHLRGQTVGGTPLFEAQMITRLFLHSDNAAQHFKSSKSLHLAIEAKERHGLYFGDLELRSSWARQGPSSGNRLISAN